jgi:hypothetical protein
MDAKAFMGKGLKFPLQIDKKTGRLAVSMYEEDIAQSVEILVRTYKGERVMQSELGFQIADLLFDVADKAVMDFDAGVMGQQIQILEPRVMDVTVSLEKREGDDQSVGILVSVEYTVRQTNNRYNKVYLVEGSNK